MGKCVFLGKQKLLTISDELNVIELKDLIYTQMGVNPDDYYLLQSGKILGQDCKISSDVQCVVRLVGGKGGFGSMLRAIGAQIEKTTNREACRDLSGRRLRDINEEKRLKAWLEKQKDREAEAEEKRRKKIEKLVAIPKHEFKDSAYESARSELTEKVSEAVEEGFKKANLKPMNTIAIKRKAIDSKKASSKKVALWISDDFSSSSETDSESDEDAPAKLKKSRKDLEKGCTSNSEENSASENTNDSLGTKNLPNDPQVSTKPKEAVFQTA